MKPSLSDADRRKKQKIEREIAGLEDSWKTAGRRLLGRLPSDPRCTLCLVPFKGLGGRLFRVLFDRKPSRYNPLVCNSCDKIGRKLGISVTVEMSMLFADIRGSTPLAETMDPGDYTRLIDRFYTECTHVLVHGLAFVDKLAGDQVSGYFVPGMAGKDFARHSVETALELLRVTGYSTDGEPWVPVGIGINTGEATLGFVGSDENMSDLTALGDAVNAAARLASQAAAGEVLISESTAKKAGLDTSRLVKRTVRLKGKSNPMEMWVLKAHETER